MGRDVDVGGFSRDDRREYREKVRGDLAALRRMLDEDAFEGPRDLMGVELEFHVTDGEGLPMHVNERLLDSLENPDFQTELARFNIEFNLAPHALTGPVFSQIEEELTTSFAFVRRRAEALDAHVLMVGTLPTVRDLDITVEAMTENRRYHLLNDAVLAARGEDLVIDIPGPEPLELRTSSITMEAAATSVQLHLQTTPASFHRVWNAAQAVSAVQVATAANSPFFLGHELMRETRIAIFEQVIDTRTEEIAAQGVRPRVWFGERWIDGPLDLFHENVTYFPALLPQIEAEDPEAVLDAAGIPHLHALTLHNGTVWRWNRPVYGVARGKPHLRVENRVLPAGPTVVDVVANSALYFGLVRALAESEQPIEQRLSFGAAADNFRAAAHDGIDAQLFWPGVGEVPAPELVLRTLLPLAHEGLRAWGVADADRERLLAIIEQRCLARRTGATWQRDALRALLDAGVDRDAALLRMLREYRDRMVDGAPVHTWDLPTA